MATWDELERAVRMWPDRVRRTSTDADLDAFEAKRGVKLPDSYREFAKIFGRCEMSVDRGCVYFAVPGPDEEEGSACDLGAYDRMMHEIALDNAEEIGGEVYDANTDIGIRLVFFASDVGSNPFGFDPGEITEPATGECAIYTYETTPTSGYMRVASSLPEFVMDRCFSREMSAWREWVAAGGEASRGEVDDCQVDPRILLEPM